MKSAKYLAFAMFAIAVMLRGGAKVQASCGCELTEDHDTWAFYDCGDDSTCNASEDDCGTAFCGEDRIDWNNTFCGNAQLLVTCKDIG